MFRNFRISTQKSILDLQPLHFFDVAIQWFESFLKLNVNLLYSSLKTSTSSKPTSNFSKKSTSCFVSTKCTPPNFFNYRRISGVAAAYCVKQALEKLSKISIRNLAKESAILESSFESWVSFNRKRFTFWIVKFKYLNAKFFSDNFLELSVRYSTLVSIHLWCIIYVWESLILKEH
jgi:hypothetical protein